MAASLAEIVIVCLVADWLFRKIRLPGLVGMLMAGAILGPAAIGAISPAMLAIGADLRMIALVVILLRAGLELSRDSLDKVGLSALFLAVVPAAFEVVAVVLLGPPLLGLTPPESAILGCVLGAVSPAVVVPMMMKMNRERRGVAKGIPTLVLAGASIDDVTVIVAFGVFMGMYTGGNVDVAWKIAGIPISIATGIGVGLLAGWALFMVFNRANPRATKRALALLAVSVALVHGGAFLESWEIPFAPLLAVMAAGFMILQKREAMAHELSAKFGKIWVFAEIILFSMVGAQLDFAAAADAGFKGVALVFLALIARSVGTWLSVTGAGFTPKEKLFVVISYLPKATVQAAMGSAPLAAMASAGMATRPGEIILAVAVMSILLTAPAGAIAISWAGSRLLTVDDPEAAIGVDTAARESDALEDDDDR